MWSAFECWPIKPVFWVIQEAYFFRLFLGKKLKKFQNFFENFRKDPQKSTLLAFLGHFYSKFRRIAVVLRGSMSPIRTEPPLGTSGRYSVFCAKSADSPPQARSESGFQEGGFGVRKYWVGADSAIQGEGGDFLWVGK